MTELTSEEQALLKWVLQEVNSEHWVQPLESLAGACELIDLGKVPDGLERSYYGMSYKHQLLFLEAYVSKMI